MRVCVLGNIPLSRLKAAFIRDGYAVYACGDVRQWMREIEDRTSVIHEFAPEAVCIVLDVGYSETEMMSRATRDASVAKVRECFPGIPVAVPYLPQLSDAIGLLQFYDVRAFKTGQEPFTEVGLDAIVDSFELECRIHPCKAILVSDDDTLWGGCLRDLQFKGVGRRTGFTKELRRFLDAGIPVVLVSQNEENEVARTLSRWGMGVKYEYFRIVSCGHRTVMSGIEDVCDRLGVKPRDVAFLSGSAEDRALARSFYPEMVVAPSRREVNLNAYLRHNVALCFSQNQIGRLEAERMAKQAERREHEAEIRWGRTIQQFRDKVLPIRLHAENRVRGRSYEDIERMKARAELRSINMCVTRMERELVPIFSWTDLRAWYVTASVGKWNEKVFMASVVVGIRNGKATVSDLLLNHKYMGLTVEYAVMNYVREQLLREKIDLIGFESGYGFDALPFAVDVGKAIAAGYGRDRSVPQLHTYCKWV